MRIIRTSVLAAEGFMLYVDALSLIQLKQSAQDAEGVKTVIDSHGDLYKLLPSGNIYVHWHQGEQLNGSYHTVKGYLVGRLHRQGV